MAEYQNELQTVMQKLNELPDATSQQLKNRIAKSGTFISSACS